MRRLLIAALLCVGLSAYGATAIPYVLNSGGRATNATLVNPTFSGTPTNFNGVGIITNSINSNRLDTATLAILALAGTNATLGELGGQPTNYNLTGWAAFETNILASLTNGFPWGVLYDAAGSATAATNGWPWTNLVAQEASHATNADNAVNVAGGTVSGDGSGLTNLTLLANGDFNMNGKSITNAASLVSTNFILQESGEGGSPPTLGLSMEAGIVGYWNGDMHMLGEFRNDGGVRVTNTATGNLVTISNGSVTVTGGQFTGNGAGVTNLSGVAMLSSSSNYFSGDIGVGGTVSILGGSGNTTLSNVVIQGTLTVQGVLEVTNLNLAAYSGVTNSWTANTAFPVAPPLAQTNYILASGEATLGIPSIGNVPAATTYYGELTVYASGTITFTNAASVRASDFLTTRTITNGNTADIAIKVVPGRSTNMAILQY